MALAAAPAYQALRILPYTRFWRRQVLGAPTGDGGGAQVSLLVSNVLMTNRDAARLLALVRERDPDLVLLAEPDAWWEAAVEEIAADRPHTMRRALPNTYGLLLYSRLPFEESVEERLVEDGLPSFHVVTRIGGERVQWHFVHPKPPAPGEADDTTDRDAELLIVGKRVAANGGVPTIVAGDLNDVAWSGSTRLFQRISRLLDPRRGRGLFATPPRRLPPPALAARPRLPQRPLHARAHRAPAARRLRPLPHLRPTRPHPGRHRRAGRPNR